ncbi:hypothetical protein MLD38_019969 [Melastoma candidum]|uniref:Uncharacterized protein n=1 Tax=Melastoma candidum TaxID=119954 RepID=A0ACB9QB28_9MYRT|nr:hypothetical protein MLD38_019969 [Melastoma candidum]
MGVSGNLRRRVVVGVIPRWGSSFRRPYGSKPKADLKKLRPMIMRRLEGRAGDYPIQKMVPLAQEVLLSWNSLRHGVSEILKAVPVSACKLCPEVYVGEKGHLINTCSGYKRMAKRYLHEWVSGGLTDILVPVEAFHLRTMFQDVIKHQERFDYDRTSAVVELCWQAGADPRDERLYAGLSNSGTVLGKIDDGEVASERDLMLTANRTLRAWETLRDGLQKLLLVYPAKVCKYCSEVHIGPSGHKARMCGVFKFESWRGGHFWQKARVDDLVPPKIVWHRRPQDPPVLVDEGKEYYGHAPAVVDLCVQAGAVPPVEYRCMMKTQGLAAPFKSDNEGSGRIYRSLS